MILFNFIMAIQVILYLLIGTVLYVPDRLLEAPFRYFYNLTQVPSTTTTTTEATTTTPAPLTVCTASCGRCESVTALGGVIVSPNYPASYGARHACMYTITVPANKKILLTFNVFAVEQNRDWINVFNGINNVVATRITLGVSLTGYTIPASKTSTGNIMTVHFRSNGNNNNLPSGTIGRWQATYTVI